MLCLWLWFISSWLYLYKYSWEISFRELWLTEW